MPRTRSAFVPLVSVLALFLAGAGPAPSAEAPADRLPPRPWVIAHRGASGHLPEHTLPAYAAAYFMGADFLEPDVAVTADGQLVVCHDVTLDRTTDVERRFPGRAREDGKWYVVDFTLEEIRSLSIDGPDRFDRGAGERGSAPATPGGLRVPTLREVLELLDHLNRQTGRRVGVIPEMKSPAFYARNGRPMEAALLDLLAEFGYAGPESGAVIQSFDHGALRRLREEFGCRLPLLCLLGRKTEYDLDAIAAFADGVSRPRGAIEEDGGRFIEEAHARGLFVISGTFADEPEEMARYYHALGVDGLFSDFTDAGVRARDAGAPAPR